jgi:hypothetical protein
LGFNHDECLYGGTIEYIPSLFEENGEEEIKYDACEEYLEKPMGLPFTKSR